MARSQVTDMMIDIAERFKDDSDVRDMLLSSNKVSSVTLAVKSNSKRTATLRTSTRIRGCLMWPTGRSIFDQAN